MGLFGFVRRSARVEACRTNALAAEIFAACPRDRSEAQLWAETAKSWSALANVEEPAEGGSQRDRAAEGDLRRPKARPV